MSDQDFESEVYGAIVSMFLRGYCDFHRRIYLRYCRSWPFPMMWLMYTRKLSKDCFHRRQVAAQILNARTTKDKGDLIQKLLCVPSFVADLTSCYRTGTLQPDSFLHSIVRLMIKHAFISTEHVEATTIVLLNKSNLCLILLSQLFGVNALV